MRRLAAAALAAPVIASIYLGLLVTVPAARRYLAGVLAIVAVGVVGIALAAPTPATSTPPSRPSVLAADLLAPIETGLAGTAGPDASAADGQGVSALAGSGSATGTSVDGAAVPASVPSPVLELASNPGSATGKSVSTAGAVRAATIASFVSSRPSGNRVRLDSGIVLRFSRPVTMRAVKSALAITPAVRGTIKAITKGATAKTFVFTPAARLAVNTTYTVKFKKAVKDAQGVAVATPKPFRILTAAAPALVRFRPSKGATEIDPTQLVSARFTKPMNPSATARAFTVVVDGRRVGGKVTWAENNSVLVFTPSKPFVKGTGVGVRLAGTATSADGVPIKRGGSVTFKVVPGPVAVTARKVTSRPAAVAKPTPKPVSKPKPKPRSGGGSVGGGSWAAAERYYLSLMNCTRTGGWVTSSGTCSSPGGRGVAPLWIDAGISARVSRPYAKHLAQSGICSHFADGSPGTRLRRAGYSSSRWAENISCPKSMNVMGLMVYTQQYFQNERSYNGGHYRNLMNPAYDRVGIGVWVANGRAELVIDFYRP